MLTTVAHFLYPWEAHMLRGRLEAEDIPASVAHEYHVAVNWPFSNALGGVKVQVPREMMPQAFAIERSCRNGEFRTELRELLGDLDDAHCPACGSEQYRKRRPIPQILLSMVLLFFTGVVWPPWRWLYTCKNCRTEFKF